jgi:hypothetical protein
MCPNTIVDLGAAAGAGAPPPPGEDVAGAFVSTVAAGPAPRAAPTPGDASEPLCEPADGAVTGESAVFEATGIVPPTVDSAAPGVAPEAPGTASGAAVRSVGAEAPGLLPAPASLTAAP